MAPRLSTTTRCFHILATTAHGEEANGRRRGREELRDPDYASIEEIGGIAEEDRGYVDGAFE